MRKIKKLIFSLLILLAGSLPLVAFLPPASTNAATTAYQCGSGSDSIATSIDFGCNGNSCLTQNPNPTYCGTAHSATLDILFAIIRFLSDGVGLVIIASVIIAGIQYTFSRGNPQSVALATKRIQSSLLALAIFIFAYALLNFVVPNGVFGQ